MTPWNLCACFLGGDWALKHPTFAVVNDVAHIAQQLPRRPEARLVTYLRRAGSNPKKAVKFRAKVVVDALKWQVGHNLIYYDMWVAGKVKYDLFDDDDDDDDGTGIEVDVTVELTEEEEGELFKVASSSQQPSSTSHSEEGSMVLLQSDPEAVSKEVDVSRKLGLDKAPGEVRTELSDEYVAPWEDTQFDAKAFPTLHPFGLGGLPGQGHGLANAELERLHLQRGGDRKHQQSMPYVFEKYTRRTRKAAGAIALIASEYTGQGTAPPGEEPAPGIALGNPISELGACTTAADILGVLEKDDGKNLKKLLGRLEPFASGLAGSPLHIANERKQLFAMLASRLLNKDGFLAIFGVCPGRPFQRRALQHRGVQQRRWTKAHCRGASCTSARAPGSRGKDF